MLQDDLVRVFSKYPQFDSNMIEVDLRNDEDREEVWISIPLKR